MIAHTPDGWQLTTLGQLARVRRGASPRPIDSPQWFASVGPGWVRISDVTRSNGRLHTTEQCLSPKGVINSVSVKPGQLIMSICATIGEPVILEIDACIHDGFVVFDQHEETLLTEFLFYFIRYWTPNFRRQGQTGTQANLNTGIVNSTSILLPPLHEQRRIAEILDTADAAIHQTEKHIAKLKQVKSGLLHDLLTRGIDAEGRLRDPVAHLEQFKDSRLGRIPGDWEIRSLEEVAQIGTGLTLGRNISGPKTIELPYLRVANVQDGYLNLSDVKTTQVYQYEVQKFLLQPGDVLMNEGGDFDKLGRGTVWSGEISPCLHQNHVFRVRTNRQQLLPEFLALISASPYGKRFFILSSKQSTNLASINSTQLKAFPIPCPPIIEQQKIVDTIKTNDVLIENKEDRLIKLRQVKQGLMHDLLTGRVRV